jgi:RHS repeat-associated protein
VRRTPGQTQTNAANSSLRHKRARFYHAQLGRFISRDPLGYVDGMSLYRAYFVPGGVDPSGMAICKCISESWSGGMGGGGSSSVTSFVYCDGTCSSLDFVFNYRTSGSSRKCSAVDPSPPSIPPTKPSHPSISSTIWNKTTTQWTNYHLVGTERLPGLQEKLCIYSSTRRVTYRATIQVPTGYHIVRKKKYFNFRGTKRWYWTISYDYHWEWTTHTHSSKETRNGFSLACFECPDSFPREHIFDNDSRFNEPISPTY